MVKFKHLLIIIIVLCASCKDKESVSSIDPVNWSSRMVDYNSKDSLASGTSYPSIYSEIYSLTEHKTHDLTATVSMRNINLKDSIFISNAEYYNSEGVLIRTYFDHPIYIAPLETVEIVIDEEDQAGGTGANFIFNWKIPHGLNAPLFEGIMISTSGQQGLSFTTRGIKIK
ncbi:DUF3124 domain-containing protein [Gramella jeungdoensis]|uniref:DUF3124 domain-containing protein n=1 Tax=Gramella jeungdoensis TaxID=708091 RepID=A0ABT0Z4J2_9FLAO|nr:DUF3124 domain-containing protein [Gramella jeungdoensis]MCM8570328.1 DUF3124 domain-containing protein [Gramella jeungdoensis]